MVWPTLTCSYLDNQKQLGFLCEVNQGCVFAETTLLTFTRAKTTLTAHTAHIFSKRCAMTVIPKFRLGIIT